MRTISVALLGLLTLLAGCGSYQMEYGKMDKNGVISYPLCERSKQRITDLRSMSFDLPELFKQAPCINWPDYTVFTGDEDTLHIEIPSVIDRGNLRAIGKGGYGMTFHPGTWYSTKYQEWWFLNGLNSPETFLQDWIIKNQRSKDYGGELESGFVDAWQGGRCLRLAIREVATFFDYRYDVEYYCWPSSGGASKAPFYIRAGQSIPNTKDELPPKSAFIDIDKELIQPVLDSLQLTPVPEEALLEWAKQRENYCNAIKKRFYGKSEGKSSDFPDRRRLILKMRDCGNDVPDPPSAGIDNWNVVLELDKYGSNGIFDSLKFFQNYEYISTVSITQKQNWKQFRVPKEQFARIKTRILGFDLLKESEPVRKLYKDRSDAFYDAWYYVPPDYERSTTVTRMIPAEEIKNDIPSQIPEKVRSGVGFYYNKELNAPAIDINFDSGFKLLTLIEGD